MNDGRLRIHSVEDFGKASARLANPFVARREVLAELGLDEDAWDETQNRFRTLFQAESRSGNGGTLVAKFRIAFEKERYPLTDEAPAPKAAPPKAPALPPAAPPPAGDPPRRHEIPTYMRESRIALSSAAARPASPHPAPLLRMGVPLVASIPSAQPSPSRVAGTAFHPEGMPIPREATPFQKPITPTVETMPSPKPVPQAIPTGTAFAPPPAGGPTLPFKAAGHTAGDLAGWTVERYAELCVDLSAGVVPRAKVLSDAGLTEELYKSLDAWWEDRVATEMQLAVRFTDASQKRRERLKKGV